MGTEGLGEIGNGSAKRRGIHKSVRNVLKYSGPGGATVRIGVVGPVRSN